MKQETFARISLNNEEIQTLTKAHYILEKVSEAADQMKISVKDVNDAWVALTNVIWRDECIWVNHENSGE